MIAKLQTSARPSPRTKDRKDRIDWIISHANKLDHVESARAWHRLVCALEIMTEPDARPPRFNGLLNAIWQAATNEKI